MKLAAPRKKLRPSTPLAVASTPTEEISVLPSTLPGCTVIALAGRVVGRKKLAYAMHISKTLYDMWCSGEKPSPISRTAEFVKAVADEDQEDIALAACQEVCSAIGAVVLSAKQVEQITAIAAQAGIKIRFDEWESK